MLETPKFLCSSTFPKRYKITEMLNFTVIKTYELGQLKIDEKKNLYIPDKKAISPFWKQSLTIFFFVAD